VPLPVSLRSNKCAVFCSPLQLAEAQDQLKKTELEAQAAREKLAAQERAAATSAEEAAIQVRPGPLTAPSTLDGADSKIWQAKAMKLDIHQTGQRAAIAEGVANTTQNKLQEIQQEVTGIRADLAKKDKAVAEANLGIDEVRRPHLQRV
jgi:peptidoglycan hydrolase CwlO-like protein